MAKLLTEDQPTKTSSGTLLNARLRSASVERERILANHKTTILELVEDIGENILQNSIERTVCTGIHSKLRLMSELEMMKISVEVLLRRERSIADRTDEMLEETMQIIFKRLSGGKDLEFPFSAKNIPQEDKDCIWRFIDCILGWVKEYKKNT
jgi:hypothetical protein